MAKILFEDVNNVERLTDVEDFNMWKFQVNILLNASELSKITLDETPLADRNAQWIKKDALAQKIIISTINKKPLTHLLSCTTAHQMWKKLCEIYERDSQEQKCSLMQTFYSTMYDKNQDIATYISRLKNLISKLTALGTEINDDMLISKILVTLPREYKHFATVWESTEQKLKTIENLTARLISEESRIKGENTEEKVVAFKAFLIKRVISATKWDI